MHYRLLAFFLFAFLSKSLAHEGKKSLSYPFIENKGQWNEQVKFKSDLEGATIYFESNAFHYQFKNSPNFHAGNVPEDSITRGHVFNANFIGSNKSIDFGKQGRSYFYKNYFLGNEKSKWASNVHSYSAITYKELYNGIDLEVYLHEGFMKYDYHISPGTSPEIIEVEYEGVDKVSIEEGALIIHHSLGKLIEEKPYAYQMVNGLQTEVPCFYKFLENGHLGFEFPKGYSRELELIIDPTLVFSTYSGSTADNFGQTATYDQEGNGYMGGIADGTGYVVSPGAYQRTFGGDDWDIAITKFKYTGDSIRYSTYIGGNRNETVHSLVVDNESNLYLLGATSSTNYPTTTSAVQSNKILSSGIIFTDIDVEFRNGVDIVVTKLDSLGSSLLGSTYYGGSNSDGINQNPTSGGNYDGLNFNYGDHHRGEIIIDSLGACYIGTTTYSDNLATVASSRGGGQDGLVVKFNNDLSSVIWSRYIGGTGRDAINSLKVIDNNRVLIGGGTTSFTSFPTTPNAYATSSFGGEADGFISIISSNGATLEKSTFIGTSNYDQVYFIEFDRFNKVYAYGQSEGGAFPVKNSPNANVGAGQFILKMDNNLDSIIFSKTFGDGLGRGTVNISPTAFLVDKCQNIYAAGWGGSIRVGDEGEKVLGNNMTLVRDTIYGPINSSAFYLYVTYLNPEANEDTVYYANLIGGSASGDHVDGGTSRFDKDGVIYHSVCASCGLATSDFPTSDSAYSKTDNSPLGRCNNLIFKIDLNISIEADFTLSDGEICLRPGEIDSVTVFNRSIGSDITTWNFYGDTVITKFKDTTIYFSTPGRYKIEQIVFDSVCAIGAFKVLRIDIRPDDIELVTDVQDSILCFSDSARVFAFSNGLARKFIWSRNKNLSNPIALNPTDSTPSLKLLPGINKFYVEASDPLRNACEKFDSVSVFYVPVTASAMISADTVCIGSPVQLSATLLNVDTFLWKFGNGSINNLDTNTEITYPNTGSKQITFVYENNTCAEKDSVSLTVYIQPNDLTFSAPQDSLYCGIGIFNVSLNSSGTIDQYIYSSNNDFSDTLNTTLQTNSINITQNDSSRYYVKISNAYCENTDSILIKYIEYNVQLAPIIDTVCTPYTAQVSTTVIGVDSFRIVGSNGFSTNSNQSPQITFNQEGIFDIELQGSNARCNLNSLESETIHVFQSVSVVPIMDTLICQGQPVQLIGNSQGVGKEFVWADNPSFSNPLPTIADSILSITPLQTSTYFFKATNVVCESEDTVTVSVEELEIEVDDFRSICIFDTIQMEAMINMASSPLAFIWSPNDSIISGQNTAFTEVSPKEDMFFFLETTSQTGCVDKDTIEVEVNLPAFSDAQILGIDSLYKGQGTQLSTNRNGNNLVYRWEPPEGIDNVNSPNPNVILDSSKEYLVTIIDLNTNCEVIARRRLFVFEVNCAEPDIFVPTAFTPNGDLSNDVLYVRGANLREIEFQLFNRWGELVFETKELNKGWNGTYQGKIVDPGVFVYQLKAICFDGQEYIGKGNITLIR